jgi:hypothetical protein
MSETESLVSKFHPIAPLGLRQLIIMADLHQGKKNMQLWMDDKAQVTTNAFEWALTKQMSRPLFTSNFQKTSKIIIKQVDLAEMEKSICGTSNESF